MEVRPEHAVEEIKRLQRCLNDLATVLALPGTWSGGDRSEIGHSLLDLLLPMLRLDLVYLRLTERVGEEPIEIIRIAQARNQAVSSELCKVFRGWLHENPEQSPPSIRSPIGEGELSIVALRLGVHGELGLIVAGSQRPDFPAETERLVLSVAAHQAATEMKEARFLSEQRRVMNELDQRVAQRTAELAAANEDLRKEVAERRRAEAALRQSEARLADGERDLQLTIDTIPVFVATYRPDGTRSFVNRTWQDYMGLTLEEATGPGAKIFPHFHPDDAERNDQAWRASLKSGEPLRIEVRVRRADGQYRWHTSHRVPLRDENGDIIKWYSVGIDIDDQKVAEDALRRSEARLAETERELRKIINTIPALAWSARTDGTVEFFNQHYLDYVGLSLEQVEGRGWTLAAHPDDLHALAGTWQVIVASGQSGEAEARLRRHDGEYRWFLIRVNPFRDESDNIIKWYGTNIDIEDRKRTDEALRREVLERQRAEQLARIDETRFRRFFELPLIGMAVASPECRFLEVNEKLCQILGYTREELIGRDWVSITHPDDLPGNLALLNAVLDSNRDSYSIDKRYIHRDGHIVYASISVCCVRHPDGSVDHFVLTVQDVTLRHEVQEKLERTEAHLKHGQQIALAGTYEVHLPQPFGAIWSDEHYRVVGLEPGSPVPSMQEYAERFVHPDDREYWREAVMRRASADQRFTLEYRIVRADGELRYLQSITDPVKDASGRIVRLVGTVIDVTERRLAEQEIVRGRDLYAALSQTNRAIIHIHEPRALFEEVCRVAVEFGHFCQVWAGLLDERTGWVDVIGPQGPASAGFPPIRVSIDPNLPEGRGFSGAVLREGRHYVVNDYFADPRVAPWAEQSRRAGIKSMVTLPLKRHGRTVGVLNVHADEVGYFTDDLVRLLEEMAMSVSFALEYMERDALRAEAEAELRNSEARFRNLAELSSDWYWTQDENLRFMPSWSEDKDLAGYSPESWIGKTRWELPGIKLLSGSWREHQAVLKARQPFRDFEYCRVGPDGFAHYLSVSGAPVFDEQGRFKGYEGVGRYITERKRVEEELYRAQAELAHVARATTLGELAASIAHEINQPLAAIVADASAGLNWLEASGAKLDHVREALTGILSDGERAGQVVARVRALLSRGAIDRAPCDLSSVIGDVAAIVRTELRQHGIVLETILPADVPKVLGDRIQLQQVVLNLLMNAMEAVRDVPFERRRVIARSMVERNADALMVVVAVEDAGVGFRDSPTRVFEAFYTTKPSGLGMGLSISRSIIERHGGRLWATANREHGATFHFAIPALSSH